MITEKQAEQLRFNERDKTVLDLLDTVDLLWRVARAARKWTEASIGEASLNAETEMVRALNDIGI